MEDDELKHYGVIGMRWGRHKNPSKAFAKSSLKADKLIRKSNKAKAKVEKLEAKKVKYESKNRQDKAAKVSEKIEKKKVKSLKKSAKADKWMSAMGKTFAKTKMSDITQKDLITGRDYVMMLRKA